MSKVNVSTENYPEDDIEDTTWTEMQGTGVVFLPAAGCRDGDPNYPNPACVNYVGSDGYYYSASSDFYISAYCLSFSSGNVNPNHNYTRYQAYSVRLVTDCE